MDGVKMKLFIAIIVFFISSNSFAETFMGIRPLETLASIKKKFPFAAFENDYPERNGLIFYRIRGNGIPGIVVIQFEDKTKSVADVTVRNDITPASTDQLLFSNYITWIPTTPIPFPKFTDRYGIPSKSGLSSTMEDFAKWEKCGLVTILSEDKKTVEKVYYFYDKEYPCD